ncbi:MAG: hypothetical protein AAGE01_20205, partial [Pseudomonadota bacterium]
ADRRPWIAAGLAACGLLPTLLFDLRHDFAALGFQLAERHPWRFQTEALAQPLVQAIVTVPLLYIVLLAAAVAALRRWRGDDPAWAVVAAGGVVPPLLYFSIGLFADQDRVGFHWPAPGYLVLCAAAPLVLNGPVLRRLARWGWGLGVAATLMFFLGLAVVARQPHATGTMKGLLPVNAIGWPELAGYVPRSADTLVADNFLLGAELAFELRRDDVYVLDHPRNQEHGRAVQLAVWGLDEASLPPGPGVLVVEDTAIEPADRPGWARRICERFPDANPLVTLQLLQGSKRFRLLEFGQGTGSCDHPAFGYIDAPTGRTPVTAPFSLAGWAFDDDEGVAAVTVLVDGRPAAEARFGEPRPDVATYFGGTTDPDGVRSLKATVPAEPGTRALALRMTSRDGGSWETRPITIEVAGGD